MDFAKGASLGNRFSLFFVCFFGVCMVLFFGWYSLFGFCLGSFFGLVYGVFFGGEGWFCNGFVCLVVYFYVLLLSSSFVCSMFFALGPLLNFVFYCFYCPFGIYLLFLVLNLV